MKVGTIYLIHFEYPVQGKTHYLGFTQNLEKRFKRHMQGRGAVLMRAVVKSDIRARVVRTWEGTYREERRMKNMRSHKKLCPVCCGREDF